MGSVADGVTTMLACVGVNVTLSLLHTLLHQASTGHGGFAQRGIGQQSAACGGSLQHFTRSCRKKRKEMHDLRLGRNLNSLASIPEVGENRYVDPATYYWITLIFYSVDSAMDPLAAALVSPRYHTN